MNSRGIINYFDSVSLSSLHLPGITWSISTHQRGSPTANVTNLGEGEGEGDLDGEQRCITVSAENLQPSAWIPLFSLFSFFFAVLALLTQHVVVLHPGNEMTQWSILVVCLLTVRTTPADSTFSFHSLWIIVMKWGSGSFPSEGYFFYPLYFEHRSEPETSSWISTFAFPSLFSPPVSLLLLE